MAQDDKKKKLSTMQIGLIAGGSGLFAIIMIVIIVLVAKKNKMKDVIPDQSGSGISLLSTLS